MCFAHRPHFVPKWWCFDEILNTFESDRFTHDESTLTFPDYIVQILKKKIYTERWFWECCEVVLFSS
jgi:hypothetical protein